MAALPVGVTGEFLNGGASVTGDGGASVTGDGGASVTGAGSQRRLRVGSGEGGGGGGGGGDCGGGLCGGGRDPVPPCFRTKASSGATSSSSPLMNVIACSQLFPTGWRCLCTPCPRIM